MKLHIHTININLGSTAMSSALMAALNDKTTESQQKPAIGEYWQGQGGIYVGRGRGRDSGRDYDLILPTDSRTIFKNRSIGTYEIDVKGATSDHDGLSNTMALAAAGSELCKEALEIEIEGHKDFHVPSRIDLRLLWANVPELFDKEWYLSSTQHSSSYAWIQYVGDGVQLNGSKKVEASCRLVRRSFL